MKITQPHSSVITPSQSRSAHLRGDGEKKTSQNEASRRQHAYSAPAKPSAPVTRASRSMYACHANPPFIACAALALEHYRKQHTSQTPARKQRLLIPRASLNHYARTGVEHHGHSGYEQVLPLDRCLWQAGRHSLRAATPDCKPLKAEMRPVGYQYSICCLLASVHSSCTCTQASGRLRFNTTSTPARWMWCETAICLRLVRRCSLDGLMPAQHRA